VSSRASRIVARRKDEPFGVELATIEIDDQMPIRRHGLDDGHHGNQNNSAVTRLQVVDLVEAFRCTRGK